MIYGICGKKRVGKDTVAGIVEEHSDVISIALADEIKYLLENCGELHSNRIIRQFKKNRSYWEGNREATLVINNNDVVELFRCAVDRLEKLGFNTGEVSFNEVRENTIPWTIRRIMQTFGTDIVCNQIGKDVWISLAFRKIFSSPRYYQHILIKDVRQIHEAKYLRMMGAKLIHVQRDSSYEDSHSTEQGVPVETNDIVVINNGTLTELKNSVLEIIN